MILSSFRCSGIQRYFFSRCSMYASSGLAQFAGSVLIGNLFSNISKYPTFTLRLSSSLCGSGCISSVLILYVNSSSRFYLYLCKKSTIWCGGIVFCENETRLAKFQKILYYGVDVIVFYGSYSQIDN